MDYRDLNDFVSSTNDLFVDSKGLSRAVNGGQAPKDRLLAEVQPVPDPTLADRLLVAMGWRRGMRVCIPRRVAAPRNIRRALRLARQREIARVTEIQARQAAGEDVSEEKDAGLWSEFTSAGSKGFAIEVDLEEEGIRGGDEVDVVRMRNELEAKAQRMETDLRRLFDARPSGWGVGFKSLKSQVFDFVEDEREGRARAAARLAVYGRGRADDVPSGGGEKRKRGEQAAVDGRHAWAPEPKKGAPSWKGGDLELDEEDRWAMGGLEELEEEAPAQGGRAWREARLGGEGCSKRIKISQGSSGRAEWQMAGEVVSISDDEEMERRRELRGGGEWAGPSAAPLAVTQGDTEAHAHEGLPVFVAADKFDTAQDASLKDAAADEAFMRKMLAFQSEEVPRWFTGRHDLHAHDHASMFCVSSDGKPVSDRRRAALSSLEDFLIDKRRRQQQMREVVRKEAIKEGRQVDVSVSFADHAVTPVSSSHPPAPVVIGERSAKPLWSLGGSAAEALVRALNKEGTQFVTGRTVDAGGEVTGLETAANLENLMASSSDAHAAGDAEKFGVSDMVYERVVAMCEGRVLTRSVGVRGDMIGSQFEEQFAMNVRTNPILDEIMQLDPNVRKFSDAKAIRANICDRYKAVRERLKPCEPTPLPLLTAPDLRQAPSRRMIIPIAVTSEVASRFRVAPRAPPRPSVEEEERAIRGAMEEANKIPHSSGAPAPVVETTEVVSTAEPSKSVPSTVEMPTVVGPPVELAAPVPAPDAAPTMAPVRVPVSVFDAVFGSDSEED